MEARITEQSPVTATIEVSLPTEAVDAAFERVLSSLSRQVRIPGFRPGKVPRGVLIKRIGEDSLAEEVRDALVDEHYPQAVRQLELNPIHAHFHAEPAKQGEGFSFVVHADLFPEFELGDVDAVTIEAEARELSDDDVQGTVKRLRDDNATLVPADRPIEAGDLVYVETQGEGGGSVMPIDLDRTEPRLVEQLVGRRLDEVVELDLGLDPVPTKATDEASGEALAKGEATTEGETTEPIRRSLTVKITDVKSKELPEADDAFAATLGYQQWSEVEAEIRRGLGAELERETFRAQRDEFIEKLTSATEVALPAPLVRRRSGHLLQELAGDLQRRGQTLDQYIAQLEGEGKREEFEAELLQAAERGVKRDLVLERLWERRGEEVSDADFEAALRHLAQRERKDLGRFKRDMGEDWLQNYRFLLGRDRVIDALVREKTGRAAADDDERAAAAEEAADAMGEPGGDHDHDHDGHDHHHHDHDGHDHHHHDHDHHDH